MATIDGPKYAGVLQFDLSDVKDILIDAPPGALQGARGVKEGIDAVLTELAHAVPLYGDAAEIHPAIYQRVVDATAGIGKLDAHEIRLEKALEVVRESRVRLVNNREDDISAMGGQAEKKAAKGKSAELAAHFEQTIAYRSQIADRSVETRRKNGEAKAEAAKKKPEDGGGSPTG